MNTRRTGPGPAAIPSCVSWKRCETVPRPAGPASETSADRRGGGRDPGPQVTASGACTGGTVTGQPRRLLRLEAAVLLA